MNFRKFAMSVAILAFGVFSLALAGAAYLLWSWPGMLFALSLIGYALLRASLDALKAYKDEDKP